MNSVQTDNSHFAAKIKLRMDNLPRGSCSVLDCFGGQGLIWETIKGRLPKKDIKILRIDLKKDRSGVYLAGDNRKFLASLDLNRFNVIDLDAYGVPFEQLQAILRRKRATPLTIFATFIQSLYGRLPVKFLAELGYSQSMVKKCPSLFNRDGLSKLKAYLALAGIKKIKRYSDHTGKKHYICFEMTRCRCGQ